MLIVMDSSKLLSVYRTIEEVKADLEWQDVGSHEYDAIDETGRVYEFVVQGYDYSIVPSDFVDPARPMTYLKRFAVTCGIVDLDPYVPLSSFEDWQSAIDRMTEELTRLQRLRNGRRWGPFRRASHGCSAVAGFIALGILSLYFFIR